MGKGIIWRALNYLLRPILIAFSYQRHSRKVLVAQHFTGQINAMKHGGVNEKPARNLFR